MTTWFVSESLPAALKQHHAGSKAHDDVQDILGSSGFGEKRVCPSRLAWRIPTRIGDRLREAIVSAQWKRALTEPNPGDVVVIQHPFIFEVPHATRLIKTAKDRGVRLVSLVHDLELLRLLSNGGNPEDLSKNLGAIERALIACSDAIIVHNEEMTRRVAREYGVDPERIVPLQIFDYLLPAGEKPEQADASNAANAGGATTARELPVVIAGNLNPEKAGYVYHLPSNAHFNLYGPNFHPEHEEAACCTTAYHGSYPSDQLIEKLEGSFGLVWDGNSTHTCSGIFGAYLRVNNPHKTSLYLAAGMPVIIWSEAALAPFIIEHDAGFAVSDLAEIGEMLASLSAERYESMQRNAKALSHKLQSGWFTREAVQKAAKIARDRERSR